MMFFSTEDQNPKKDFCRAGGDLEINGLHETLITGVVLVGARQGVSHGIVDQQSWSGNENVGGLSWWYSQHERALTATPYQAYFSADPTNSIERFVAPSRLTLIPSETSLKLLYKSDRTLRGRFATDSIRYKLVEFGLAVLWLRQLCLVTILSRWT